MKAKLMFGVILTCIFAVPAFAQDAFRVAYRLENVEAEGSTLAGRLLVSVYNVSGADARDVAVSIPGPNSVTYDNHSIFIGTLADGQSVETLDMFRVPVEMRRTDRAEEQIEWDVEFTNGSGKRQKVRVVGRNAQFNK